MSVAFEYWVKTVKSMELCGAYSIEWLMFQLSKVWGEISITFSASPSKPKSYKKPYYAN